MTGQFKIKLHQDDLFQLGKVGYTFHLLSVLEGGQSLKAHLITTYPHRILIAIHYYSSIERVAHA